MEGITFLDWVKFAALFVSMQLTVVGAVWSVAWTINRKFTAIYDRIQQVLDLMISKLEKHEEHDQKRFDEIKEGIWALRAAHSNG